jgi:hypothetical protein
MMEMAILQLFKNQYRYPKYSATLTAYGSSMDCTPVGIGLKSGRLRVKGDMVDFMSCNYLSLTRTGKTIYAWIDDVNVINDSVFEIQYSVDSWRTFKDKVDLGVQFVKRSPAATYLKDPLLGSTQSFYDVSSTDYSIGAATKRIAVVQVRGTGGQTMSNSPVQPTPYQFYLTEYSLNSWQDSQPLVDLMSALPENGETQNLVTIYSIPWIDISGISTAPLIITIDNNPSITVNGWKGVTSDTDMSGLLYNETPILTDGAMDLMKKPHSIQVVIPEAGILNVPDELWTKGNLKVRQDIDLFSGACNYMLTTGSYATGDYCFYTESVRGSSVSSIPILTNPEDTYISQNQNALTTSLIGDVANIGMGFAIAGASPDPGMKAWGLSSIVSGGVGIMENMAQRADGGSHYSNPPAFLGTAMAANFNGTFWVVIKQQHVDNETVVHANYGYPYNKVDSLTFPSSGYIETQNCNVSSTDGSVPRWALEEINTNFDNGILVK